MIPALCLLVLTIFFAVSHPALTFSGAASGLQIWFFHLLPTLLPFIICANFFLSPYMKRCLSGRLKMFRRLPIAPAYLLVILTGYTFGLPVGAKITVSLLQNRSLSKKEAQILVNHCNVISPAFVSGFLVSQCLQRPDLLLLTLASVYLPQIFALCLRLFVCRRSLPAMKEAKQEKENLPKETPRLRNCFQILDVAIMNGFETVTVLGGYLILFGILCAFVRQIRILPEICKELLIGCCEITTGIHGICQAALPFPIQYLSCTALCAFGGLCTAMQTLSVMKTGGLSLRNYLFHKLFFAMITLLCSAFGLLILY